MNGLRNIISATTLLAIAGAALGQVSPGSFSPEAVEDYEGTPGGRAVLNSLFGGLVPVIAGSVNHSSVDFGDWQDFRAPGGPIQPTSGNKFGVGFGFGDFTLDFTSLGGILGFSGMASAAGFGDDQIEFFDMGGALIGSFIEVGGFGPGDGSMVPFSFVSTVAIGSIRLTGRETAYDDLGFTTTGGGSETWVEGPGDAGRTLAEAQVVHVDDGGTLASIEGALATGDVDIYRIHVCDPAAFSASTVGGASFDTVLYLFTSLGVGIAMSDDAGGPQSALSSTFMSGLDAGDYYLAVAAKGALPLDLAGDALFDAEPAGVERGPDGPGAANGVWVFGPGWAGAGAYAVTLTGASLDACSVTEARSFGVAVTAGTGASMKKLPMGGLKVTMPASGSVGSMRFHYGQVDGETIFTTADPSTIAPGATIRTTTFGDLDGVPDQELETLFTTISGTTMSTGADFSRLGSDTYTATALLNGVVVDEVSGLTGPGVQHIPTAAQGWGSIRDCFRPKQINKCGKYKTAIPVSIDGGDEVIANEVIYAPTAAATADSCSISSHLIDLTGISEFVIDSAVLAKHGAKYMGLGEVLLTGEADQLRVADIGSSGQDGLEIQFPDVQQFDIGLAIEPPAAAPVGSFLHAETLGTLGGVAGSTLGRVEFRKSPGEQVDIEADFAAIGSPTQRVIVLNDGVQVVDIAGHTGVIRSSGWFDRIGKLGGQTECYRPRWPRLTRFIIAGQAYEGDELQILAEGGTAPESKSALRLTAAGVEEFAITGVDTSAPCRVDLDGDGVLDIFDFLAFLNLFDAGDPRADFDGDGQLTIFDFLAFGNEFDAGCP